MSSSINQLKAFYPLETGEDNKILRAKCQKVDIFDNEIRDFCDILVDLMYGYDGVGLAAPQISQEIRIIAVTQWKETRKGKKVNKEIIGEMAMVNPEILDHSDDETIGEEACLSVPGICGDVKRWSRVVVRYQDKKGKVHTQKFSGFNATVIQHEMDHLEGILFTDKIIGSRRTFEM